MGLVCWQSFWDQEEGCDDAFIWFGVAEGSCLVVDNISSLLVMEGQ